MSQLAPLRVRTSDNSVEPLESQALRRKYERANALIASVLNKYYNGSARAVDPFVIRRIQEEETRLFSIQCYVEEGPAEARRERKESSMASHVTRAPTFTLLDRVFGVCGGYLSGPGSVMRRWEELSDAGYDDAMREYIALVDKIVPGWDHEPLDYPVAKQDKFWKDDASALQCQYCGAHFSLPNRRHHCRMCLDVFCLECCSASLELALCPGAPLRSQRVCCQCYQDAERSKSLVEVRRVIRENHDLEQQIKRLQAVTDEQLATKHREETKLRQDALANGCDMDALDASILKRISSNGSISSTGSGSGAIGGPSSSNGRASALSVTTPPAHKFAPRETIEANEQLALANRQLVMGLKVAQCRAKRALESMDATLSVLREAICFGSANWTIVLQRTRVFLTLRDVRALACASKAHRAVVARCKCERKCVLEQGVSAPLRPALWQLECLRDDKTRVYVSDLADEICRRLDASDSDDSDDAESPAQALQSAPQWLALLSMQSLSASISGSSRDTGAHTGAPSLATAWDRAYALVLARCSISSLEFDVQIENDVQRTFGVSALRKMKQKQYQSADASPRKPEFAVERRRSALANVLRSFASVHTEIGYCQGLDHVAALLLSVVEWHEARAFWLLTTLVVSPRYELDALYTPGLPHLSLRCYQLERVMALHLPELATYLRDLDFPISMCATSWFVTLFTSMETLSYDLTLRVLDGFLVAGWKHLFRIALVILEMLQILASPFEEIPQLFYDIQEHAPQLAHVQDVLARAAQFKVTTSLLKRFQREYEASTASPVPVRGQDTAVRRDASVAPTETRSSVQTQATRRMSATPEPSSTSSETARAAVAPTVSLPRASSFRSSGSPPNARRGSAMMKKSQLAAAAATAEVGRGEKSPDSTRAATPLRTSTASTRIVV